MLFRQQGLGWGKTRKILNPTFRVNPTYFSRVRFRVRVSKIPLKELFFDQETLLIHQVKTVITRLPNGQQLNCIADNRPEKQTKKVPSSFIKSFKSVSRIPLFQPKYAKLKTRTRTGFSLGFRVPKIASVSRVSGFRVTRLPHS